MNLNACKFVCPICREEFDNVHSYAEHINQHSEEEKKKKVEEERQRKADQKKLDVARLEKLRKMYEDAYSQYAKAKEKYIDDYGEIEDNLPDTFNLLKFIYDNGLRWGN